MSLVFKKIEPLFIAVCWLPRSMSLKLTVTVHTWMRPWCPQLNLLWKQTRCTFAHVGKLMDNLEIGWLLKDYYANFHNFLNQRSIILLLSLQDTTECMLSKYLLSITSYCKSTCQENFKSWLMSLSTGHPTNFSQVFEIADHATADMSLTLQFSAMNEQKHVQFLKREFKVCFLLLIRCL